MSEIVMTTEAEVEDFTDELSDEALDRAEGALIHAVLATSYGGGIQLSNLSLRCQ